MFVKLNGGDVQYHLITLELINRVLKINGDYAQCYDKIVEICFTNAPLVNSLNKRFKALKKNKKVVTLSIEEFQNFIINNSNQKDMKQVYLDVLDVNKPLNIKSAIEQVKAKTVVTDEEEIRVAEICALKP